MDQNHKQPQGNQMGSPGRGPQPATSWDGHDRRIGMPDRRQQSGAERQNRNTAADLRMMNEGSSR